MKVTLVGKQVVSYTKKQTGELKEGLSVFYTAPKQGVDGECADSIWISKGYPLYDQMKAVDLSDPLEAEVRYDVFPGSRFPVLAEIEIFD